MIKYNSPNKATRILFTLLFFAAFLERVVFDLGANVELVTMSMVVSSLYIGRNESFWLIFLLIAVTDRIIGNTNIFLFTWSGFLIPAVFASHIVQKKQTGLNKLGKMMIGTGLGLGTSLFFFLWTNFGVWALDTWGMYTNDLSGLLQSYVNALPFFRANIISAAVFVPLGILLTEVYLVIFSLLSKYYQKLQLGNLPSGQA